MKTKSKLPKSKLIPFEIIDVNRPRKRLKGQVVCTPLGISLSFKGYGEKCSFSGQPVFIELYDGKVVVRAWADINQEDPTHTIDLSGAKNKKRSKVGG